MPFYNSEATLADAIRSVFAQTRTDWELILADDGSTDRSLDIAMSVDDPRVRVLEPDRINRGLSYRLNQIAEEARGAYIVRMDADDLMFPNRLERQIGYLDEHPGVDLVGTGMCAIGGDYRPLGIRGVEALDTRPRAILERGLFVHVSVAGRAEWMRRNPYDGRFPRNEDHELWCRTFPCSRFAKLAEPLIFVTEVGSFDLRKYWQSGRTERRTLRVYGPAIAGVPYTLFLMVRSYTKNVLYSIFTAFNMPEVLIRKRNFPLIQEQRTVFMEIIRRILSTPVPGLSHTGSVSTHTPGV